MGAPNYPVPEQPYPSNYPLVQLPAIYYQRPVDLGVLKPMGFVLVSVGFFLLSGSLFYLASDRSYNLDYKTLYYLEGSGWLLVGIGMILVSVAEFIIVSRRRAPLARTQMDLER